MDISTSITITYNVVYYSNKLEVFNEIHRKMDEVFSSKASLPIKNLEQMIKDH